MSPASLPEQAKPLRSALHRLVARVTGAAPPVESKPIPTKRIARRSIGKGFIDPGCRPGLKRIVVTVDEAMFARIRARALKQEASFASAVRELIEAGERATDKTVQS